jgi:DUF971 family protein
MLKCSEPARKDGLRRTADDIFPKSAKPRSPFGATRDQEEMHAPRELRVSKDRRTLTISFPEHRPFDLPAELLRVLSPSAEVQGHSPEQRVTVPGKRNVAITKIDPVGNYAVRITFDDFHDTGIFTWDYLHTLGHEKDERWQSYLDELAAKGMSRD